MRVTLQLVKTPVSRQLLTMGDRYNISDRQIFSTVKFKLSQPVAEDYIVKITSN